MKPLQDLEIAAFITALASDEPRPGAGAAGALALAFACGCARKAALLSLRHVPDDPTLPLALPPLARLTQDALAAADEDAAAFAATLSSEAGPAEAGRLAACGARVLALCDAIEAQCIVLRAHVHPTLAGDLFAAGALVDAARRIQRHNLQEAAA